MSYSADTVQQLLGMYSGGYSDGLWQSQSQTWSCVQGGAATACATLYVLSGRQDQDMLLKAQKTVDKAISTRRLPDGSFVTDPAATPAPDLDGPRMIFWADEMAMVYLLVAQDVTAGEASKWRNVLKGICDYWVSKHELTFYANGNLKLQTAEAFWMTYRATGDAKYLAYYQQMLAFTKDPSATDLHWAGYGLVVTKQPMNADGSDGSAYFTETGAGGTGYDPEYTQLQLQALTRLYLLSGDIEALRLTNMLTNQLLSRVNASTMTLDASHGSRHVDAVRNVPFMTPALTVLSTFAGRADLAALVPGQQTAARAAVTDPNALNNDDFRRCLGNDLSVSALAEARYGFAGLAG